MQFSPKSAQTALALAALLGGLGTAAQAQVFSDTVSTGVTFRDRGAQGTALLK